MCVCAEGGGWVGGGSVCMCVWMCVEVQYMAVRVFSTLPVISSLSRSQSSEATSTNDGV